MHIYISSPDKLDRRGNNSARGMEVSRIQVPANGDTKEQVKQGLESGIVDSGLMSIQTTWTFGPTTPPPLFEVR